MFGRHGGKKIKALRLFNFVYEAALKKKAFDLKSQPAGSREGISVVYRYKGQRASQKVVCSVRKRLHYSEVMLFFRTCWAVLICAFTYLVITSTLLMIRSI